MYKNKFPEEVFKEFAHTVSWNSILFQLNNKFPAYLSFSRKETDFELTVPDNPEWSGSGNKFT